MLWMVKHRGCIQNLKVISLIVLSNREEGTEKFSQIRRYAVALEICLFLHQNLLFKIGKQQNYFNINF
jgi:hypothetical protein